MRVGRPFFAANPYSPLPPVREWGFVFLARPVFPLAVVLCAVSRPPCSGHGLAAHYPCPVFCLFISFPHGFRRRVRNRQCFSSLPVWPVPMCVVARFGSPYGPFHVALRPVCWACPVLWVQPSAVCNYVSRPGGQRQVHLAGRWAVAGLVVAVAPGRRFFSAFSWQTGVCQGGVDAGQGC